MADEDPILAGYDARIAALEALKAAYLQARAVGAIAPVGDASTVSLASAVQPTGSPLKLPKGAFLGKSVPDSILLYLGFERQYRQIKDITAALEQNGVKSSGKLSSVVTSALHRLKSSNPAKVLQSEDGWGLPEWLPPHLAGKIGSPVPKRPEARARKAGRRQQNPAHNLPPNSVSRTDAPGSADRGTMQRLIDYFTAHPGQRIPRKQAIQAAAAARSQTAALQITRLCRSGFLRLEGEDLMLNSQ